MYSYTWFIIFCFTLLLALRRFQYQTNAVNSDAILLPARRVGTKRALSNPLLHDNYLTIRLLRPQHGMQQFFRYAFFLVLVKKTLY